VVFHSVKKPETEEDEIKVTHLATFHVYSEHSHTIT
jgi:hypothetical protein